MPESKNGVWLKWTLGGICSAAVLMFSLCLNIDAKQAEKLAEKSDKTECKYMKNDTDTKIVETEHRIIARLMRHEDAQAEAMKEIDRKLVKLLERR